jgi:Sulfatase
VTSASETSGVAIAPWRLSRTALGLIVAAVWLSALWNLPTSPSRLHDVAAFSLEIVALFALLALFAPLRSGMVGRVLRCTVAAATSLVVVLTLGDLAIRSSLGRPLNALLDLDLLPSLVHLLRGALDDGVAALVIVGLILAGIVLFVLTLLAVGAVQRGLAEPRLRSVVLAGALALIAAFGLQHAVPQLSTAYQPVVASASAALGVQWQVSRATLQDLAKIKQGIAADEFRDLPADRLLTRLGGADVLLIYVESYGRTALEQPRYAERLLPRLASFDQALADQDLVAASGFLTSPTVGGQSWLAHGTIQSGLWIANERAYDALVKSNRLTLTKAFAKAGYRTLAVKPAITMPWPEGGRFGYDRIYASDDLGYAGLPYNWVTMPDQYTLSALERFERVVQTGPLFAEVSLISSHAPWTPIAPVLDDWDSIGDGAVFSRWAQDGDPPEVVWRDVERVRDQYALAIDYVLAVLASYAARFVDEQTLLILVGDHQPAPLITSEGPSRDVPIHVIAGDSDLLEPFRGWGMTKGMRPAGVPLGRMDEFRDRFIGSFSEQARG